MECSKEMESGGNSSSMDEIKLLAGIFQTIAQNCKNLQPVVGEFILQTNKLESQLRGMSKTLSVVLDCFNAIAIRATNSHGSSKDIGHCLSQVYLHNRTLESYLSALTSALSTCINNNLKSKTEEFKKKIINLEKSHSKEFKKIRHSIKRKLEVVQKLEKKLKKESLSMNREENEKLTDHLCQAEKSLAAEYKVLEEQERQAVRRLSIAERSYLTSVLSSVKPAVIQDVKLVEELTEMRETASSIDKLTSVDPEYFTTVHTDHFIQDLRLSDVRLSFQTPPGSPRDSQIGSRCGSMRSLSSFSSSRPPSPPNRSASPIMNNINGELGDSKRFSCLSNQSLASMQSQDSCRTVSQESGTIGPGSSSSSPEGSNTETLSMISSSRGRSVVSNHQQYQRSGSRPYASPSRHRPNSAASNVSSGSNNTAFSTVKRAHSPFRLKTLSNECSERAGGGSAYSSPQGSPAKRLDPDMNGSSTVTRRPPLPRKCLPNPPQRTSSLDRKLARKDSRDGDKQKKHSLQNPENDSRIKNSFHDQDNDCIRIVTTTEEFQPSYNIQSSSPVHTGPVNPYPTINSSSSLIPNAALSNGSNGYSIMPSCMGSFGGSASNLVAYTGTNKMNSFQGDLPSRSGDISVTLRDSVTTVTNSVTAPGDTKSMAVIHPYTPNYCLPRSLNINFNEDLKKDLDINKNPQHLPAPNHNDITPTAKPFPVDCISDDLATPVVEIPPQTMPTSSSLEDAIGTGFMTSEDDATPTVEQRPYISNIQVEHSNTHPTQIPSTQNKVLQSNNNSIKSSPSTDSNNSSNTISPTSSSKSNSNSNSISPTYSNTSPTSIQSNNTCSSYNMPSSNSSLNYNTPSSNVSLNYNAPSSNTSLDYNTPSTNASVNYNSLNSRKSSNPIQSSYNQHQNINLYIQSPIVARKLSPRTANSLQQHCKMSATLNSGNSLQPSTNPQSISTPNSPARRANPATTNYNKYTEAALANKNNNIGMLNGNIPITIPNNTNNVAKSMNFQHGGVEVQDGDIESADFSSASCGSKESSSREDDIWTRKILPDTRRNTLNRIQRQKSDPGGNSAASQIYSFLQNKNNSAHRHGIVGMNTLHGYNNGDSGIPSGITRGHHGNGFPLTNGNLGSRIPTQHLPGTRSLSAHHQQTTAKHHLPTSAHRMDDLNGHTGRSPADNGHLVTSTNTGHLVTSPNNGHLVTPPGGGQLMTRPALKRSQSLSSGEAAVEDGDRIYRRSLVSPERAALVTALCQRMKARLENLETSNLYKTLYQRS